VQLDLGQRHLVLVLDLAFAGDVKPKQRRALGQHPLEIGNHPELPLGIFQ